MNSFAVNTIHERIYRKLLKLVPNLWILQLGEGLKSTREGYMDLSLDVLSKNDNHMVIALSHYYKHPSGDMIADPDMEIRVSIDGQAEALTYQDAFGYQHVYTGGNKFYPALKKSLNAFLNVWIKNCIIQGHQLNKSMK